SVPAIKARQFMTKLKTARFATVHLSVAFTVVYLLTGDAFIGGVMAMLEPSLNTVAYYVHEKVWLRKSSDQMSAPHFCFH
ncbi:DUF2061 domain-containing protein, partial [Vibrio parahaemolyticus]|uniref:DUF2061 domain-containing protein n=1 Tax=Vibrio parahaemolyticus TaxID=670 RepID=UPI0021145D4C